MSETIETIDIPTAPKSLKTKALIVVGAAAGIILAGGLAVLRKNAQSQNDTEAGDVEV